MFEQVKDYKSACAVLGIKPIDKRRKLVKMPQNMQLKRLNHYI